MTSLTIKIPDKQLQQLQQLAQAQGISTEQLLQTQIEKWLNQPPDDFKQVADYVLSKNAQLYQRLA
jgi:antitoxin FitA